MRTQPDGSGRSAGGREMLARRMGDGDTRRNPAPRREPGHERQPSGFEHGSEIVDNPVADVFVEDARVAKGLQIDFQALQLNATVGRDVAKRERAEVWLAGFRTDRGELGADDLDEVVAAGKLVREGFQQIPGRLCDDCTG